MVENVLLVGVRRSIHSKKNLLWNEIWHEAGCPSTGMLSQLNEHAKARYKHAVRRLERNQDLLRCRKMAEALVGDSSRDFWQEVSQCKASKQMSASYVDGVHDDASIANLWASKFKDLLTSPDPKANSLSKLKITRGELEATEVLPDIIQRAIKKLKRGKSDGEAVSFDHLILHLPLSPRSWHLSWRTVVRHM